MLLTELLYTLNSFYLLCFGLLTMLFLSGLILYATGHARSKNTTSVLAQTLIGSCISILAYVFFGNSILYGQQSSISGFLGTLDSYFLTPAPPTNLGLALGYNPIAALFFQMFLPALSVCLIASATSERIKVWAFVVFAVFFSSFIYPVEGYWLWGGGFLYRLGFIDNAGSSLVYLSAAVAGLTGIIIVGPRHGKFTLTGIAKSLRAANLPIVIIGLLLIFIGSLGFNAGTHTVHSHLASIPLMSTLFLNSSCAACTGMLTALIITRLFYGTIDLTFAANGMIASLAAIAADPLHASLAVSVAIAAIAAILAMITIKLFEKAGIDDPAGTVSVCGSGSIWGLIACALIQNPATAAPGWTLWHQLLIQLLGVVVTISWVAMSSALLWLLIRFVMGLRVRPEEEIRGLDVIDCGMSAYPEFTKSAE